MNKLKLNKKIMQAAVFSSALTLYPHIAYGATGQAENIANMPASVVTFGALFGGIALMAYRDEIKDNKERLYNLEKSIIPSEYRIIEFLKAEHDKMKEKDAAKAKRIELDIKKEYKYLKRLKKEKIRLCKSFNIDENDETQMNDFLRKNIKKQKSKKTLKKIIK